MTSSLHRRFCLRRSRTSAAKSYAKIPQLSAKNLFLNNIIKVPTFQLSKMIFPSNQVTFEHALPSNPAFPAAHRFGALPQDISFIPRRSFRFQPFLLVASQTQCFFQTTFSRRTFRFVSRLRKFRACFQNMNSVPLWIFRFQPISPCCRPDSKLFSEPLPISTGSVLSFRESRSSISLRVFRFQPTSPRRQPDSKLLCRTTYYPMAS